MIHEPSDSVRFPAPRLGVDPTIKMCHGVEQGPTEAITTVLRRMSQASCPIDDHDPERSAS